MNFQIGKISYKTKTHHMGKFAPKENNPLYISTSLLSSNFYLLAMLLSNAQKFAYYAQYYAHEYCNYATICI